METTLRNAHRHHVPLLPALLWVVFIGVALFIQKAVGCPLAGCGSATVALVGGIALAVGLGALMSYADRRRDCEVSHRRC